VAISHDRSSHDETSHDKRSHDEASHDGVACQMSVAPDMRSNNDTAANSEWRLATGDWSNGSDVGVAISHDGKRQRVANSEWRIVGGEWQFALKLQLLEWLLATKRQQIANGDWRLATGQRAACSLVIGHWTLLTGH
jgi:hypothetical protein